jgi:peptide deformylase
LIRDVIRWGDPRLLADNREITEFGISLSALIADLVATCHAAPGLGLAAPQIGVNERVAVVDLSVGEDPSAVHVLVNPVVVERAGEETADEGCLSLPGLSQPVVRPARVIVEASDSAGRRRTFSGGGLLARALCHEIDHLDSRLFVHHLRGIRREMTMKKIARRWG